MEYLKNLLDAAGRLGDDNPEVRGAALLGCALVAGGAVVGRIGAFLFKKKTKPDRVLATVDAPKGTRVKLEILDEEKPTLQV